jgi:hypothetical protein
MEEFLFATFVEFKNPEFWRINDDATNCEIRGDPRQS